MEANCSKDKLGLIEWVYISCIQNVIASPYGPTDETLNVESLFYQLLPIFNQFQFFGCAAGISQDKLDRIVSCKDSSYQGLLTVCDLWLMKCRDESLSPTWHAVAEILSSIGQEELAADILQVYVTGIINYSIEFRWLKQNSTILLVEECYTCF